MPRLLLVLLLVLVVGPATAQHEQHHGHAASAYAGETDRAVKALSAEETADLLAGAGMGLARAAELNGYPGPKHVLELADGLALTADQRAETERLRADVQAEAKRLGAQVVEIETHLDRLFADGQATPAAVDRMLAHLGEVQGQLRAAHLKAHIAMHDVLTAEQIAAYNKLRGYEEGRGPKGEGGRN